METTKFANWFLTFLQEKELDLSTNIRPLSDGQVIQVGDIAQLIMWTSSKEQSKIKDTIVLIDFANGSILDYFKHLSQAITPEVLEELHCKLASQMFN